MTRDTEREIEELPEPAGSVEVACGWAPGGGVELMCVDGYTAEQMRAYAAAEVSKERERCDVLTDDMLRYAMAAMGTGSPREADNLRTFWRFAIEARNTKAPEPAKG